MRGERVKEGNERRVRGGKEGGKSEGGVMRGERVAE